MEMSIPLSLRRQKIMSGVLENVKLQFIFVTPSLGN